MDPADRGPTTAGEGDAMTSPRETPTTEPETPPTDDTGDGEDEPAD